MLRPEPHRPDRTAQCADDDLADGITRTLREAGFSRMRRHIASGQVIASAYLPRLGHRRSTERASG
jgi:hypothetical protein